MREMTTLIVIINILTWKGPDGIQLCMFYVNNPQKLYSILGPQTVTLSTSNQKNIHFLNQFDHNSEMLCNMKDARFVLINVS